MTCARQPLMLCLLGIVALGSLPADEAAAPELTIAAQGQSAYQIVLPAPRNPPGGQDDRNLMECARLLRDCLLEATGAGLPIVLEPQRAADAPAILLGDTAFARRHHVKLASLRQWQYLHQTIGEDIILAGLDETGPVGRERTYHSIGTMKAVTTFLQERVGVRFLLPGENGIHIPRREKVTMPAGRSLRRPNLDFNIGVHPTNPYCIANNLYDAPYYNTHGGHSYYVAVPTARYGKTHPEYFALHGGRRNPQSHHLCISNPQVQELIYQELVGELDRGFEMTELGQTDGYLPCQCGKCRGLFGQKDPGEKLWILHRSFAERLMKERPGRKVVILAYGATSHPPVSFDGFPPNVVIELCSYREEDFAAWRRLSVPGGFLVYIYNWGNYQHQGFTAKFGPRACERQIILFHKNNVRGLYRCGFGELFGLEGPLYYAWGRGFDAPRQGIVQELLEEFYRAAYGPALSPMRRFFTVLYDRLDYLDHAQDYDRKIESPLLILAMTYTPDVLLAMERNLARAESTGNLSAKERTRIRLVRRDFAYTRNLARIVALYHAQRLEPSPDIFGRLAAEIETRNKLIEPIVKGVPGAGSIEGWPHCPFRAEPGYIRTNGRLRATINAPLDWDIGRFRRLGIIPGKAAKKTLQAVRAADIPMDADGQSGPWAGASWQGMTPVTASRQTETRFKLLYDDQCLYLVFDCRLPPGLDCRYASVGRDGPAWEQECLEILLDVEGDRERYRHFIFNPVADSSFDAAYGYVTDPLHPLYNQPDPSWNGSWQYHATIRPDRTAWNAVVKIPFRTLGLDHAPEPGTAWTGNFGREHIARPQAVPQLLLWSPSQETSSFHDPDSYGEIVF